ncbi:oligosaccharide flippase family protein [Sphingomonas sp. H39-1-10]|uniref:oligosaccharide flippase family protein n=1 Tax=Sphingomonas pollutisoli TaxID=3030829 RepID=UPI0023B9C077|nr:oligosaccharide flippase family protein [Sphingomonas pollutisoli]MDF0487666.1 oligosaccharide flippase family protein [Sphingomonas pollutisoli]
MAGLEAAAAGGVRRPGRQSAAGGLAWLVAGRSSNIALSIVTTAILSRFLTPQQFGQLVPVMIVISLSMAVFDGTFGVGIIRSPKLDRERVRIALGNCLLVAVILAGALVATSPLIERFFHFDRLAELIAAATSVILLRAVFVIACAVLQRERRYKAISLASLVAAPCGSLLVSVPLAISGCGAWSLLLGTIAMSAVETAIVSRKARLPWRVTISRAGLSELGATEGFFALNQLLNWAALSSTSLVAGHFLGLAQLGYYSRSWRLLDIAVSATSGPMQRVLVPIFAGLQDGGSAARATFERALAVAVPLFAVAGTFSCLHAEAIVRALLGKQWLAAIPLVQILFSALVARCGYKVSESVLVGFGRARSAALRQFVYLVALASGALIAVRWQSAGVALSTSIAVWLFYALSLGQAVRLLHASLSRTIMIHARAAALAGALLLFHVLAAVAVARLSYWSGEMVMAIADALFLGFVLFTAPSWLVDSVLRALIRQRGRAI